VRNYASGGIAALRSAFKARSLASAVTPVAKGLCNRGGKAAYGATVTTKALS